MPAHRALGRGDAHRLGLGRRVAHHEGPDHGEERDRDRDRMGPVEDHQPADVEELHVAVDRRVEDLAELRHLVLKTGKRTGMGVASKEKVKHCHEVRFASAERAVDEGASRACVLES